MLEAVQDERYDIVLEKLKASQRSKDTEVKEAFEVFNKAQSVSFWDFIWKNSKSCIDRIVARGGEDANNLPSPEAEEDIANIKSVLHAFGTFHGTAKFKPTSMFALLESVQSTLTLTTSTPSMQSLKSTAAKLCELWWLSNDEGAENLISQLLTYLLITSLGIDGHEADIKRLYTLRSGFLLLDFEDPSSLFLRGLIERCFVHPAYLKSKDGHKLLAFLLNANQGLLLDLVGSVIRPQIATGNKTVAAAYGKILYLAWRDAHSQAEVKDEASHGPEQENSAAQVQGVEDAVQNLLRDGIHAAEAKYFRGVRFLLQSFHDVQRSKLDAMLLRVYDPILWRSLRCANATVRAQAAVVFLDVFPLQHADGRAEDNDRILQKQFDLLAALLTDSDQRVRADAALGVCHILKEYWEALPVNTTHTILKYLVDTLSCDASCANVRLAVFVGLGELFQQPLTHTVLKQLLPLLKNSIHDKAEKVRVAFIRILCQIKSIRGMHFYEIVPVDHLLQRLVEDRHCPAVCRALTELLLNSFYPQSEGGSDSEALNRCVQFVDRHPAAAEVFYSHLHECVAIGHIAKLSTVLFTFLVTAAARSENSIQGEAEGDAEPVAGKRRRATKVAALKLSFNVRLGVMRVVLRLLESVETQLPSEHPSRELVEKYITTEHAQELLQAYARSAPEEAVYLLPDAFALVAWAGKITAMGSKQSKKGAGASNLDGLVQDLYLPAWVATENDLGKAALSKAVAQVLCGAGQQVSMLNTIARSLEAASGKTSTASKAKGKKAKEVTAAAALLPVASAVDMLLVCEASAFTDGEAAEAMKTVHQAVRDLVESCLSDAASDLSLEDVRRAVLSWAAYSVQTDAAAQLQGGENSADSVAERVVRWATQKLVPALSSSDAAMQLLAVVLAQMSDLLYLDVATDSACAALAECLEALQSVSPADKSTGGSVPAVLARLSAVVGAPSQTDGQGAAALKRALGNEAVGKKGQPGQALETGGKEVPTGSEPAVLEAQVWAST